MLNHWTKTLLLTIVLIVPAVFFLFFRGQYWNMHDDMQLIRQLQMEKCLFDGQIPCRWVPDLGYGYGYPLFNFYPPLPYFIGQGFRLLGFSFIGTIKFTAILQFLFSTLGMYLLAASLFGPLGGLLSAIFYTYAPYHAVNIYVRGAMNEAWAGVFFPLIFYFAKKIIEAPKPKNIIGLSLAFAGLMLSHNPMVLIFTPFLLIWCLFWLYQKYHLQFVKYITSVIPLSISAGFAIGLSAFFTLPAIFETKYVQINSMFSNYYTYAIHFVSLHQLFSSNFWGDGPSVWGPNDGLSFSVGFLHWVIPILLVIIILKNILSHRKANIAEQSVILMSIMALSSIFMAHEHSTFIWKLIPEIQKIQFPWRFLNLTAFFTSLTVGAVAIFLKNKYTTLICLCLALFTIISNSPHFYPVTSGPITDSQKFSGVAWTNQVTGGIYDYLPNTASTAPKSPAPAFVDQVLPSTTKFTISGAKKGTDWLFLNLFLNQKATVYFSQLGFPNFIANVNGKNITPQIEPELGRLSLSLNQGQNQIYIKLQNTPIRSISNIISIISLLLLILLPKIWKTLTLKL